MCNKLAIPLSLKNGLGCCLQREFGASRLQLNGNNPKSACHQCATEWGQAVNYIQSVCDNPAIH